MEVCQWLGLPLYPGKYVGPSTVLVVLDSVNQVASLPLEKLLELQNLIGSWLHWKWCNWYELKSLIGHLHHATKVVWLGRTFLHHIIDLFIPFISIENFIRIFYGGTSFWRIGMALASGSSQDCCLKLMLRYLLMLQARSAIASTRRVIGLLAPVLHPSSCNPSWPMAMPLLPIGPSTVYFVLHSIWLMNGHCAFLLLSWPQEFSTPPLRSTCPGLEHSIVNRGFQNPLPTASAFRGWSSVSSTLRTPHLHPACQLPMTWC